MYSKIQENQEALYKYKINALKQLEKTKIVRENRRKKALLLADKAAKFLREKFEVSKICLFGSVLQPDCFTQWSDLDLAVWGLKAKDTLLAMELLENLDDDIPINLVDINTVKPAVYKNLMQNYQEI